jgi:3-oxoacyl-[acyl-carrier protein] reductase
MNQLDFSERTAVITGGAVGIGFAIAQRLSASGAKVSLWDRDAAALAKAKASLGPAADTRVVDVADAASVDAATKATVAALYRIDVLVCSAGITGPNTPLWDYPLDAWRQVMDVNLNGLFYCNRAIVPSAQRSDHGRIVNIASVAGKEGNLNASAHST